MKTLNQATGLGRFHAAHSRDNAYRRAFREIQQGRKRTHWMWFVFPQLRALAKSETARFYGIADRAEAIAYIDDPVLRMRLGECTTAILGHRRLMLTHPDNHKLRSCMTLFAQVTADPTLPNAVLAKFFDGKPDQLTLDVLAGKAITLPPPRTAPAAHRWEQGMLRIPQDTQAWTRERVMSFVRSFGLSSVATRQLTDAWMADRGRAMGAVWAALEEEGEHR